MTTPLRPGWMTLGSLNSEDLHGRPGPARAAALRAAAGDPRHRLLHLTDACYGALAAGEARHALRLLDELDQATGTPDRHLAALRAWALQLDGNWYPGGVGAESTLDPAGSFVTPAPGTPETELIEHLVADGPPSLATVRTVIETLRRSGNEVAAGQMAGQGIRSLGNLAVLAHRHGAGALGHWCDIAAADLMHRVGRNDRAVRLLHQARTAATLLNLPGLVAVTHLVEGDWWATPGSHPESLGLDLAPQPGPSPDRHRHDPARAAVSYTAAASWAAGLPLPRLHAALDLRHATLAWFAGDRVSRRRHLLAARNAWSTAGDSAGAQLCSIHLLIADIDEGAHPLTAAIPPRAPGDLLPRPAPPTNTGGEPPADPAATPPRAPGDLSPRPVPPTNTGGEPPADPAAVTGVLNWAASIGSRTWCAGLGRLLQRTAEHWRVQGDFPRARAAYVAALRLLSADPELDTHAVVLDLAALESGNGVPEAARARLSILLTEPGNRPPDVALTQRLAAVGAMLTAHPDKSTLSDLRTHLHQLLAGGRPLPEPSAATARRHLATVEQLLNPKAP